MFVTPEELHKLYRRAVNGLNTADYNVEADVPYEELSEEQKSIDKYIADFLNEKYIVRLERLLSKRV